MQQTDCKQTAQSSGAKETEVSKGIGDSYFCPRCKHPKEFFLTKCPKCGWIAG